MPRFLHDCYRQLPSQWQERVKQHWEQAHPQATEQAPNACAKLERATELYVEGLIDKQKLEK